MRQIGQISEVTCIIIYHSCVSADGRWLMHSTRARYLHVHPGCSSSTDSLHGFPPNLATCCKMACTYMGMLLLAASASAPADGQRFWTSRADPVVSAVNRAAQEAAPPSRQEFVDPLADLRATCSCGNVLSRVPPHSVFDQDPSLAHAFRSLPFLEFEWMKVLPFLQNQYE